MIMYFDVHSHLNDEVYQEEINDYLQYLSKENIWTNIIGCDLESSKKAIEISKQSFQNIKAIVGIHPNNINDYPSIDDAINMLDNLIASNKKYIVAIGEIGIDLYYEGSNLEKQIDFCIKQIELSKKHNLPIMFHIRNAFEEIKPIISNIKNLKKIIHCFSTNIDEAKFYIENNCLLSIPGIITFNNAKSLQEAIKEIPIEYLLAETDSPYLTPSPFRGKINYPHYVKYVYKKISELKNENEEIIREKLNKNALEFFSLKD